MAHCSYKSNNSLAETIPELRSAGVALLLRAWGGETTPTVSTPPHPLCETTLSGNGCLPGGQGNNRYLRTPLPDTEVVSERFRPHALGAFRRRRRSSRTAQRRPSWSEGSGRGSAGARSWWQALRQAQDEREGFGGKSGVRAIDTRGGGPYGPGPLLTGEV